MESVNRYIQAVCAEILKKDRSIRDTMFPLDVGVKAFLVAGYPISLTEQLASPYNDACSPWRILSQRQSTQFKRVYDPGEAVLNNPGQAFWNSMAESDIEPVLGFRLPSLIYNSEGDKRVVVPFVTRYGFSLAYRNGATTAGEVLGIDLAPLSALPLGALDFVALLSAGLNPSRSDSSLTPSVEPNERSAWKGICQSFFPWSHDGIGGAVMAEDGTRMLFSKTASSLPLMSAAASARFVDMLTSMTHLEVDEPYASKRKETPTPMSLFLWYICREYAIALRAQRELAKKDPEEQDRKRKEAENQKNEWIRIVLGHPLDAPRIPDVPNIWDSLYGPLMHADDRAKIAWNMTRKIDDLSENLKYNKSIIHFNSFLELDPLLQRLLRDQQEFGERAPYHAFPHWPTWWTKEQAALQAPEHFELADGGKFKANFKRGYLNQLYDIPLLRQSRIEKLKYYTACAFAVPAWLRTGLCPYSKLIFELPGAKDRAFRSFDPVNRKALFSARNRAFAKDQFYFINSIVAVAPGVTRSRSFFPGYRDPRLGPVKEEDFKAVLRSAKSDNPMVIRFIPGIAGVPFPEALLLPLPPGLRISECAKLAMEDTESRGMGFVHQLGHKVFSYMDFYYDSDDGMPRTHRLNEPMLGVLGQPLIATGEYEEEKRLYEMYCRRRDEYFKMQPDQRFMFSAKIRDENSYRPDTDDWHDRISASLYTALQNDLDRV